MGDRANEAGPRWQSPKMTGRVAVAGQVRTDDPPPPSLSPPREDEGSEDDANAFLQGSRAFLLGRTVEANPFSTLTSMHGAWEKGFRAKKAAGAAPR